MISNADITPPLRVTVFVQQTNFTGGKTMAMISLAKILHDAGFGVTLCAFWNSGGIPLFEIPSGISVNYLDQKIRKWPFEKSFRIRSPSMQISWRTRRNFIRKIRNISSDIIYLPNYDSDIYDLLLNNLPSHVVKVIGDHSGSRYESALRIGKLPRDHVSNRQFLQAIRRFDAVHVVNPIMKPIYARETSATILDIPNSIPHQDESGFADLTSRRILAAGRLVSAKRFDLLIEAMKPVSEMFPDWSLDIYGIGDERKKLQALINHLDLADKVALRGNTSKIFDEMRSSAIHVSSAKYESFGLTIAEAMSVGLPTVALRETAGARFLHGEGRGYIADTDDVQGLVKTLSSVIELIEKRDASLQDNISNSFKFVEELFFDPVGEKWRKELLALHESNERRVK